MHSSKAPRTVIEFTDTAQMFGSDPLAHKAFEMRINGVPVLVERDSLSLTFGGREPTKVTVTILPTSVHFNHDHTTAKFSPEVLGDALKEFEIRATEMSSTSTEVYEILGLNMVETKANLTTGGEAAKSARGDIVTAFLGLKKPVVRSFVALALFGVAVEDIDVADISRFVAKVLNDHHPENKE